MYAGEVRNMLIGVLILSSNLLNKTNNFGLWVDYRLCHIYPYLSSSKSSPLYFGRASNLSQLLPTSSPELE